LRKADNPPITGADTLAVTVASTAMPKKRFNALLAELLDEISSVEGIKDYRARLMIIGSLLDDPRYLEIIENQGGLVVTDSLCLGSRILWTDVGEGAGDPLAALAQHYIADRPSCPRMFDEYKKRSDYLRKMIRDFKVDGAIMERLAFCDLWGFEGYSLQSDFKRWNTPFMIVEREYALGGVGQLRTRLQAFLEKMGR
jgi:benzoyl-CoA reductase/2-hydroxyglutaryl-CoA dehydratase subunit BcrC/BadD/HgdB